MVIKGPVAVQLVDATTKKPFKEHMGPQGRVYVEVEPHAEYFVGIIAHPMSTMPVGCHINIDGTELGAGKVVFPKQPMTEIGASKRVNGAETTTSFRFEKPKNKKREASGGSGMIMGSVTIRVHQLMFAGFTPYFDSRSNTIEAAPMNVRVNAGMDKKLLRTGEGTVSQTKQWGQGYMQNFSVGPLLDEFTFHYCTTPGLILAGILKRPGLQDISNGYNRIKPEDCESDILSKVKHKRFKFDGVCVDGTRIHTKEKEHDLFDLTELEDV